MLKKSLIKLALSTTFTVLSATASADDEVIFTYSPTEQSGELRSTIAVSDSTKNIAERILAQHALAPNFILGETRRFLAFTTVDVNGQREIRVNSPELEIAQLRFGWEAAYYVVAHEIGHLANGDPVARVDDQTARQFEAYADLYAKRIIEDLNGDLSVVARFIESELAEQYSSRHIPKEIRLAFLKLARGVPCEEDPACSALLVKYPPFPRRDGVTPAPSDQPPEVTTPTAPTAPTVEIAFAGGDWTGDQTVDITSPFRIIDKYAQDTIGTFSWVAPDGHDHENIGIRICANDGEYYQLMISSMDTGRFVPFAALTEEEKRVVTDHSARFRTSLNFADKAPVGYRLLELLQDC